MSSRHPSMFVLVLALASAPAFGQAGPQVWVPLVIGVPQGKPADITLNLVESGAQATQFDVRIYGFWKQDITAPTGDVYQRIEVPGLFAYGQPGAPELPVARVRLAIPTNALDVKLAFAQEVAVSNVANLKIYPQPLAGEDEEPDPTGDPGPGNPLGTAEQFFPPDPVIYGMAANWPAAVDMGAYPPDRIFENFEQVLLQVHPIRWNPTTKSLKVVTHLRLRYTHVGALVPVTGITKGMQKVAQGQFFNWAAVQTNWSFNFLHFDARYLVVTRDAYLDALLPLVQLKKKQGFQVTVVSDSDPWTFDEVVTAIATFHSLGDPAMDHYCLLVGDTSDIPLGHLDFDLDGTMIDIPTDDLYGSLGDVITDEIVFVGRLSVDDPTDLEQQVDKIVDYQAAPHVTGGYDRALMVAHLEGAPAKYQGVHSQVVAAVYSHPPTFVTAYGAQGATNDDVLFEIDQDVGLVAYRGHGTTNTWIGWNLVPENFHKNEILFLENEQVNPVVWAITCTNANLEWSSTDDYDSIAEVWMEGFGDGQMGGVASYGATITTSTVPNHELDRALFKAVYDAGITTHAQAIAVAEEAMAAAYPGTKNPWAYLLLGDPAMRIRRDQPAAFNVGAPGFLELCTEECNDTFMVTAKTATGLPAAGALVSLWKASMIPGQEDEVFTNAYANANGIVNLTASPLTPGTLHVGVQDDDGNLTLQAVEVTMEPVWTDLGHGLPGTLGTPSLVGLGSLTPGSMMASLLTGVVPNTTATLVFGLSTVNAPFKGGVFVPLPHIVLAGLPTGPLGYIHLSANWPAGVPSNSQFFLQYWMQDAAGPHGFAASNAIKGTTP